MSDDLPAFRYHPDPLRTGSIVDRQIVCCICERDRTYAYVGPIYCIEPVESGSVCPWCINDGSAAATLNATFVDGHSLASLGEDIIETVLTRTPGYDAWQQEVWLVHCEDACAFVDRVGKPELEALPSGATDAARAALRDWGRSDDEREQFMSWLSRDGDLTMYLFQCLTCREYRAHVDSS